MNMLEISQKLALWPLYHADKSATKCDKNTLMTTSAAGRSGWPGQPFLVPAPTTIVRIRPNIFKISWNCSTCRCMASMGTRSRSPPLKRRKHRLMADYISRESEAVRY